MHYQDEIRELEMQIQVLEQARDALKIKQALEGEWQPGSVTLLLGGEGVLPKISVYEPVTEKYHTLEVNALAWEDIREKIIDLCEIYMDAVEANESTVSRQIIEVED